MQSDHEKHLQRAKDTKKAAQLSASSPGSQGPSGVASDVASMYQSRDLSLKQGETIKINIKRPGSSGSKRPAELQASIGSLPAVPLIPSPVRPSPNKQVQPPFSPAFGRILTLWQRPGDSVKLGKTYLLLGFPSGHKLMRKHREQSFAQCEAAAHPLYLSECRCYLSRRQSKFFLLL